MRRDVLGMGSILILLSASRSSTLLNDFQALLALKEGFELTSSRLPSWDASNASTVCSWEGVQCLHRRVISLDLTDLSLGGSVSPAISQLDALYHLSLAGNNFTGNIVIAKLSNLQFLNISNYQFSSWVDWDFSSLNNLEKLDAYNNNLTGVLPFGVLTLEKLRYLDLGGNYFHGEIPISYGNMSSLEYLSLAGNDLSGRIPRELGNLTTLKELYLGYYNVFEGGIPRELSKLENLVHLDLASCGFDGMIPYELGNLMQLDSLYLETNLLSGPIPPDIGNLTNLVNLDLSNNALTGEIPTSFINLDKLELFNLFLNRLHGSIPTYVADFPNLQVLGLWMNNLTDTIPQHLGANGQLQNLDLSSNKLTGNIPPNLCATNQPRVLILLKNFLFGPIPDSLGTCSSLVRVRLGQNYLNGRVPNGFIYLPELNLLELQSNYLSGDLSENEDEASPPTKLAQLYLSNNLITGFIPSSISNFTSLQILLLEGNQFSGPIPYSIGRLQDLIKLDVSRNALSGQIPPEIASCSHLTYLDLSQNVLSRPIPPQISSIKILNYLNLTRNNLDGPIPESIGSMKSLTNLDFSFNNLSGQIPVSGQFTLLNASSFSNNPGLCGPLVAIPCTKTTQNRDQEQNHNHHHLFFLFALVLLSKTSCNASRKNKIIGRGGAGVVYHGITPNGNQIAVKKLINFGHNHHSSFKAEIQTLGSIRHRNIVKLLAFCTNGTMQLLIYEYMSNGNLSEVLHNRKATKCGTVVLGWELRKKVATEAAKGVCYLHHDCDPMIVHRDVKAGNILLNEAMEAHVADFGLAKFFGHSDMSTEYMSAVAGSYGYIAPEYAYTLRVDEKSDVYSFGVVLLELLTGQRPIGDFGEGVNIVEWSRRTTNGKISNVSRIIDPRLMAVPLEEAMHFFLIAMQCVHHDNSVERPTMREVAQMLSEFPQDKGVAQQCNSLSSSLVNQKLYHTDRKDQPFVRLGHFLL
ncbi:Leucine-rich repeat receptor-like serine/threonine-protein kinase BAM1-like protein [Drosera capensis]